MHTAEAGAIQKGADFLQAFMMGFEVQDAVALLRLEDLFIDSFMVRKCGVDLMKREGCFLFFLGLCIQEGGEAVCESTKKRF